jgi:predicted porin
MTVTSSTLRWAGLTAALGILASPGALADEPNPPTQSPATPTGVDEAPVGESPATPAPEPAGTVVESPAPPGVASPGPATQPPANPSPLVESAPPRVVASPSPATPPPTGPARGLLAMNVYGFLNAEAERVEARGGATPYRARGRVSDGNSRFGLAGNIVLGYHVKAVWQIEGGLGSFEQGGVNDQGVQTTLVARNTFVGVEDQRLGRLVFGYNDSAYRTLVGSAGEFGGNLGLTKTGLDVWNNTSAQMSGNPDSIFSRGEERYRNSLHLDSAAYLGLRFSGSYSFDEGLRGGLVRQRYSVGLRYAFGPFMVGVGHDHRSQTGVDLDRMRFGAGFVVTGQEGASTNFTKALASVQLPTHTSVSAGYEFGSYGYYDLTPPTGTSFYVNVGTGTMQQSGALASLSQALFRQRLVLMASGGKLWSLRNAVVGAPSDYEAWQFSVGAKYMLTDSFTTYVYYTSVQNHAGQNVNLGQAPLYGNNLGTSAAYLAPGNCPSAMGVGLIARF